MSLQPLFLEDLTPQEAEALPSQPPLQAGVAEQAGAELDVGAIDLGAGAPKLDSKHPLFMWCDERRKTLPVRIKGGKFKGIDCCPRVLTAAP